MAFNPDNLDQAQVIWKALDEMAEQSPEAYRQFISEQLQTCQAAFKNPRSPPSNTAGAPRLPNAAPHEFFLEKMLGNLTLNNASMTSSSTGETVKNTQCGQQNKQKKQHVVSDESLPTKSSESRVTGNDTLKPSSDNMKSASDENNSGSLLLDDMIAGACSNSIWSQMVL